MALQSIARDRSDATVLVVDASDGDQSALLCASAFEKYEHLRLTYMRAERPGLARQRNQALAWCFQQDLEIVHFIDDDTELLPGYMSAIEQEFRRHAEVAGVGGTIRNRLTRRQPLLQSLFLLHGPTPSVILRSGRVVPGQYPNCRYSKRIEWLDGCSMSYRLTLIKDFRFDDQLLGYSLGEDYDFSWRVGKKYRLAVAPGAYCLHHMSKTNRHSARQSGFERTVLTHRWVLTHRGDGMSSLAFLWSAVGDLMLRLGCGVVMADEHRMAEGRGILQGLMCILTRKPSAVE